MFIAEKWGCVYLYLDVKSEQPTYSLNTSQYIRINPNLVKTSNVVTILVRQTKKMLVIKDRATGFLNVMRGIHEWCFTYGHPHVVRSD